MVFNPYGAGIYRLRRTASVESCRGRRRSDLAHSMVRGRTGRSRHLFWLTPAQPACIVGILVRVVTASARPFDEKTPNLFSLTSHTACRGQSDDYSTTLEYESSDLTRRIRESGNPRRPNSV